MPPEARPTEPPTPVAAAPREEAPAARSAEAQPPPGPPATTGSVGEPSNVAVENGAPLDCLPPRMREILKAISTECMNTSTASRPMPRIPLQEASASAAACTSDSEQTQTMMR